MWEDRCVVGGRSGWMVKVVWEEGYGSGMWGVFSWK